MADQPIEAVEDDVTPLAHCTLDQIADELDRRTTAFIFVYVTEARGKPGKDSWQSYWRGGALTALGLAEAMAYTLKVYLRMCPHEQEEAVEEEGSDDEGVNL